MNPNEADRIAAQRAAQAKKEASGRDKALHSSLHADFLRVAEEVSSLIPIALQKFADDDYKGLTQVSVVTESKLRPSKPKVAKRGGYLISPFSYTVHDATLSGVIVLLSDGTLMFSRDKNFPSGGSISLQSHVRRIVESHFSRDEKLERMIRKNPALGIAVNRQPTDALPAIETLRTFAAELRKRCT